MGTLLGLVTGGESELQFARGDDGVLEEQLVEVTHAEEEQRVRMRVFCRPILPHRRGKAGHVGAQARYGLLCHCRTAEYRNRAPGFGRTRYTEDSAYLRR